MSAAAQSANEAVVSSPPFVTVEGIQNFRDSGGYSISSSNHSVRCGVIYRCAEPSRVTRDGINTLKKLGITHAYDLRSNAEIERAQAARRGGIVEWDGCERVFVPVFAEKNYNPESLALRYKNYASKGTEVRLFLNDPSFHADELEKGFTRAYTDILNAGSPSFRIILLHLAHEPSKPFIVHCTAGKDRTGIICALILSLCGVDDATVAYEYSLTEVGLSREWKEGVIEHLMENPALKGNIEGAWNMIGAKAANMLSTLKVIREKFGGAEGYAIKNCGLTKDEVEKIKTNLVVDTITLESRI